MDTYVLLGATANVCDRKKSKGNKKRGRLSFVQAVCDELDASPEVDLEDLRLGVIRRLREERCVHRSKWCACVCVCVIKCGMYLLCLG